MSLIPGIANRLCLAGTLGARRRLEAALRDPAAAQRAILLRILRANADTDAGRRWGFASIGSAAEFRARVPMRTYDDIAPDVARIAAGEPGVLTAEPVRCLEPTGGSSGPSKLVPCTAGLLAEFSAATMPWIHDLLRHRPALRSGRAYWAVTPPARRERATAGGVPIGLEHDSDYFPAFARALLDRVLGAPRALSRAPDVETARYLTLRTLLGLPDLAFVSVWNPSFLTLLAAALDEEWTLLLGDLDSGRLSVELDAPLRAELRRALPARPGLARQLRTLFGRRPPEDLGDLWPRLALVSCWTDGHARRALAGLARRFPRVEVQGKGLLATEGVVSFPLLEAGGSVAAVGSHYLELLPDEGGEAVGVEAAETGRTYEVLLTTSGGLYRYRLRDLVRVEGWHRATPLLAFVGRADRASDLAGEKLTPALAERVLAEAMADAGVRASFAMLAPVWGEPPRYALFAECEPGDAERLARAVEARLGAAHHYALCRALGQLGPVRGVAVAGAERAYERACLARGQRAGAIKPAALDAGLGWEEVFASRRSALGTRLRPLAECRVPSAEPA